MRIQIVRAGTKIVDLQINHVETGDQVRIDLQDRGEADERPVLDEDAEGGSAGLGGHDKGDTDVDPHRPLEPQEERAAEVSREQPGQCQPPGTLDPKLQQLRMESPQKFGGQEELGGEEGRGEVAGRRGGREEAKSGATTDKEKADHTTAGTELEEAGGAGTRAVPHPTAAACVSPAGMAQHSRSNAKIPLSRGHRDAEAEAAKHTEFELEHNINQRVTHITGEARSGGDTVWSPDVAAAQVGSGFPGCGERENKGATKCLKKGAQKLPEIPQFPTAFTRHHHIASEMGDDDEDDVDPIYKPKEKWHEMVEQEEHDHDKQSDDKQSEEGLDFFDKFEEILLAQSADLPAEAQDILRQRMADTMAPLHDKIKAKSFAHKPKAR